VKAGFLQLLFLLVAGAALVVGCLQGSEKAEDVGRAEKPAEPAGEMEKPPDGPVETPQKKAGEKPVETRRLLSIKEENEYWVAYESPSKRPPSLAWGDGYLWLSDIYRGTIYRARETEGGLLVEAVADLRDEPNDMFQIRDITWDGENLWVVDWGTILRHDPEHGFRKTLEYSEDHQNPPWENMHHLWGIGWDGEHIWTAPDDILNRHSRMDFHVEAIYPFGVQPSALAFRGQELWVVDKVRGYIYQLDMSKLPPQGSPKLDISTCDCFDHQAPLPPEAYPILLGRYMITPRPYGLAWSPGNLWVSDLDTRLVYKIKKLPQTSLDPLDDFLRPGEEYTVPGEIVGEVTWTKEDSPYVLESLGVPEGSTLIIEPGVRVLVRGDITVQGTLRAVGTPEEPIIFSHVDWDEPVMGDFLIGDLGNQVYPEGVEASATVLRHVVVQYFQNGVVVNNALPSIEYSVVRKSLGGVSVTLTGGGYKSFKFIGNKVTEGTVSVYVRGNASLEEIIIRENVFSNLNAGAVYLESRVPSSPRAVIENNIMDYAVGAITIFDGVTNVTLRHNLMDQIYGYRGPEAVNNSEISYNFIRDVFQAGIQLPPGELRNVSVKYNTVIGAIVDRGDPAMNVVVEYNNILFDPWVEDWGGAGPRNWWGTPDLEEVRRHLAPDEEGRPPQVEPILTRPNGIGFIRGLVKDGATGRPISEARITIGDASVTTAVNGEFFTALPEGSQKLVVSAQGYGRKTVEVTIASAQVKSIEIEV
jgi:hypothetical protein